MVSGDEGDRRLGRLAPVHNPDRGHLPVVAADEVEVEDVREAEELDLRGARLGRVDGIENLGGAIISGEQLLDLAPAMAAAAGITVGPWPA